LDARVQGRVAVRLHRAVGALVVAMILAACGPGTASPSSVPPASITPSVAPTAAPTPTASPLPSPSAATGTFALAGLSATIDKPAQTIDASMFTTTFASETPSIYILYQLTPGSSGKVQSTWKKGTTAVNTNTLDYPATAPWAYFAISYKGGFIPGTDYTVVLKVVDTGDTMTLPFTVTGPRTPPATPAPVPSGTSAFTLLRMATDADSTTSAPDATKYTDTFPSSSAKVFVVFSLRDGLTGKVVCTMTANGSAIVQPITLTYGSGDSWGDFAISSGGSFPIGDYVATLTYSPSGEAVSVPFTVH
jgi:hypothetical protein